MAISYPVTLSSFLADARIAQATLEPTDTLVTSRTRGGEVWTAEVSNVLWRLTLALTDGYHGEADTLRARIAMLRRAGASALVSPAHRKGPITDPGGTALSGHTPKINTLAGNNRELSLKGLPANFVISAGDYLSFTYGSNPTRYAFHQVVTGATANGSGVTGNIEITPHIRSGAQTDTDVKLVAPEFKAVLDEAPGYGTFTPAFVGGLTLSFIQTLS